MLSNERECKCKTAKIDRHIKGAKVPGNERARERKFQEANWPGSYWPIRSGERIGPGAKRLGTSPYSWARALRKG